MPVSPDKIRKIVTFEKSFWKEIEDYRFKNRIKTEAEAIRQLIEKGLREQKE